MDPAIRFGQQGPGHAIGEDAEAEEEGQDDQQPSDDDRVDAEPVRQAAGHPADPTVLAASDLQTANPVEEPVGLFPGLAAGRNSGARAGGRSAAERFRGLARAGLGRTVIRRRGAVVARLLFAHASILLGTGVRGYPGIP